MKLLACCFLLFLLFGCSSAKRTKYRLEVDLYEFKIKSSPDFFDKKPEAFVRVSTENHREESDTYHAFEKNFIVEDGEAKHFFLSGLALNDIAHFSVKVYDYDVLDTLFSSDLDAGDNLIDGGWHEVPFATSLSGVNVVDSRNLRLVYFYSVSKMEEQD